MLAKSGAMDMDELNRKALFIESLLPDQPLLLELTYERMVELSKRSDSCFIRPGYLSGNSILHEPGNGNRLFILIVLRKTAKYFLTFVL